MKASHVMAGAPSPEALESAAEWLDCYDGDAEDSDNEEGCKATAEWLRRLAEIIRYESRVVELAKETGASKCRVEAALRRAGVHPPA